MNKIIWWGSLLLFINFMCCVSIALVDNSLFGWVLMELALFSFVGIMISYESEFSYLVGQYSVLYYISQSLGSLFIIYFWSVGGGWFWFELGLLIKLGVWPLIVPLMLYTTSQNGVLLWYVLTWNKFPLYILTSMGWLNNTLMVFLCCLCLGGGFYYYLSNSNGIYSNFIGVLVVSGLIDSVFLLIFFLNSCSLGLSYFLVYSLNLAYILSFLNFGNNKILGIGYLLSVSGLPPFASFFIKVQLIQSLISISNWGWILWIIVFFQVLLFIFFLVCWENNDIISYFYNSFLLMGLVCLNIVTGIIFLCSLGV
uniref:NADH dehydrogenase subunit 2 n=1 Tax=Syndesmis kurakaikina TaxID=2711315 RepID=A0A7G5XUK3_9PLAT|nr:NADH dehydrogenase subunit 2 [Syndesmis kurakaikina]